MYSLNPIFESKKPGTPFSQEQLDQIKKYVDQGFSKQDIIELTGISRSTLNRRIRDNDWVNKSSRERTCGLSQQELNEIHTKYLQGTSVTALSEEYHISAANLNDRIANNKWEKARRKTKYTCDETYFDEIDTEHKAYWLGFLYADGYILNHRKGKRGENDSQSFGFSISMKDVELFEKFKADLKSNHPVNVYKNSSSFATQDSFAGRILITSQHMVDMLKKHGMTENKTYTISLPNLPKDLLPHFIRGLSDGDGSIVVSRLQDGPEKGRVKFLWSLTSTKEMCEGILQFLGKSELKLYQRHPERQVNNWEFKICGNQQVKRLLAKIYQDATIYLDRKYQKYVEMQGI